jgi:hypothetical protein
VSRYSQSRFEPWHLQCVSSLAFIVRCCMQPQRYALQINCIQRWVHRQHCYALSRSSAVCSGSLSCRVLRGASFMAAWLGFLTNGTSTQQKFAKWSCRLVVSCTEGYSLINLRWRVAVRGGNLLTLVVLFWDILILWQSK